MTQKDAGFLYLLLFLWAKSHSITFLAFASEADDAWPVWINRVTSPLW
jgi:hypothetical protein